jgi:hypothetical protein
MTKQETFDIVINHLRKQGCKAESPGGGCLYRGLNGTKCAAGILIPDADYVEDMDLDGEIRNNHAVQYILDRDGHDIDLVEELQDLHDMRAVEDWEGYASDTATTYGLTYTPPLASV